MKPVLLPMAVPAVRPLVLHVDMDAFFASVEMRSDPRLAGLPLVVGGGPGKRGVVTTASYPARVFGVHSGMAMAEALRLCPHLTVLPVDPSKYIHESLAVLAILDRISPRVEAASIDEAYLEMPSVPPARWRERAEAAAALVRRAVATERGLACSVGAAVNKLQAKMVSKLAKPDGVLALEPQCFLEVFGPREVGSIPGVGPRTVEALARLGIRTIDDLTRAPADRLQGSFGKWGEAMVAQARGEDARVVLAAGEEAGPKTAGHETTFARDVGDARELRATLWLLADRVARRLRRHGLAAGTAVVKFKLGKNRYSRQKALPRPVDDARSLALPAWELLEPARCGRALRLLGVAGAGLTRSPGEGLLFHEDQRRLDMRETEDRLRDRFGESAILPGGIFLGQRRRRRERSGREQLGPGGLGRQEAGLIREPDGGASADDRTEESEVRRDPES